MMIVLGVCVRVCVCVCVCVRKAELKDHFGVCWEKLTDAKSYQSEHIYTAS